METLPSNVKDFQKSRAQRLESTNAVSSLVCLNFKVPMRVRQQFKITAARNNLTMTELLLRMVDSADLMNSSDAVAPQEISIKYEMKK